MLAKKLLFIRCKYVNLQFQDVQYSIESVRVNSFEILICFETPMKTKANGDKFFKTYF